MQKRLGILCFALSLLILGPVAHAEDQYDTDRKMWLVDSDLDGTVDLSEELAGTDPFDAKDYPGSDVRAEIVEKVGFPSTSCRSGFRLVGSRLCIDTDERNSDRYDWASYHCRSNRARVCTYEDLFYLYVASSWDSSYNPYGMWLGDFVADDTVMYGNKSITFNNDPDMYNFDGVAYKTDSRQYYCCHDRE